MGDNAALIIIDMQRGMLPQNTGPRNNPQAAEDWRLMSLSNLHGEYATVTRTDEILAG